MNQQAPVSPRRGRWAIRSVAVTAAAWAIMELLSPLLKAVGDDPSHLARMSPLVSAGAYAAAFASILAVAGFIASAVLLIAWQYRTIRAANALGVSTDLAPVEAVVWWFVPVLNLWKPYAVMKALGAALAPGTSRTTAAWWATYLLTTAFAYLGNAGGAAAEVARFGGCATVIVAAALLARIVRGVQGGLDAAAARAEAWEGAPERIAR